MDSREFDLLVIDDAPDILRLVKQVFEDRGLLVRLADTIETGRRELAARQFRVILTDQHLPDGNGLDLLSELEEFGANSVPVLMTGFVEMNTAVEAINRGRVFKFVSKPLEIQILVQTIAEALERYRLLQKRKRFMHVVAEDNVRLRRMAEKQETSLRDAASEIRRGMEKMTWQQVAIDSLYGEIQRAYLRMVTSLTSAIEAKDRYTKGHGERVSYYCSIMADELELTEKSKTDLKFASLLHDLGKIGIPDAILWKDGRLTSEEARIVERHPLISESILRPLPFFESVRAIIRHHHERYDGTGYPDGLSGESITLEGRILSVADSYDAMRSTRPYRREVGKSEAIEQLRSGAGSQFCPKCVEIFVSAVSIYGDFAPRSSHRQSTQSPESELEKNKNIYLRMGSITGN